MRLFMHYVREHRKVVLLYLLVGVIFGVCFSLYQLPLSAVAYAMALSFFFAAVFVGMDFYGYRSEHKKLVDLQEEIKVTLEHLPAARGMLYEDCQELIGILYREKQEIANQMDSRYTDLVDYYTLWAHQIKTPIASMRLQLQNEDSQASRELLDDLLRIEQYVEMVLMYLRLDSHSSDYVIRSCSLDAICRQAIRRFASQFIRKNVRMDFQETGCQVLTDEKWLLFVIEQVLSNALKYTRPGGIVTVSMERLEDSQILMIRDNGIGIAPEDVPRIFEKGYTGYNGRGDKKASGIGLYLCRRICENLGHRIWAVSAVGEGTVIRLDVKKRELKTE